MIMSKTDAILEGSTLVMTTMEGRLPENTTAVVGSHNNIEASSTGNKINNNIRNYLESFTEENETNETSNVIIQGSSDGSSEELAYIFVQNIQYCYQITIENGQNIVIGGLSQHNAPLMTNIYENNDSSIYFSNQKDKTKKDIPQIYDLENSGYQSVALVQNVIESNNYFPNIMKQNDKNDEPPKESVKNDKSRILQLNESQTVSPAHKCNLCDYSTRKKYDLTNHMVVHSNVYKFKCEVCKRGFKTLKSLKLHTNNHTGNKPHQCQKCPKAFNTKRDLLRHVQYKHTHEKPQKCTICNYACVELYKMKIHIMNNHLDEHPYQCFLCTNVCQDKFKLKSHFCKHTGEKPYQCDVCFDRFSHSENLRAHKILHIGESLIFKCNHCLTTFGQKEKLRLHVKMFHTSDKSTITDFENESIKDTNILVGKTEVLAVKGKNGDQYNSLLKVVNLDHIDGQNQMNSDSSLNILVQQVEQSLPSQENLMFQKLYLYQI